MIDLNGKIKDLNEAFNAFAGQGNINRKFSVGKVITMDGFYCLTASDELLGLWSHRSTRKLLLLQWTMQCDGRNGVFKWSGNSNWMKL